MEFVNFEIAKKLKEKGFKEECLAFYGKSGDLRYNGFDASGYVDISDLYASYNLSEAYDAPTISRVLKWLREEKKYHIEFVGNACGYLFIVSDIPSLGGTDIYCSDYSGPNDGGCWDTYEEAALAGIEYALDNLLT